jgi:hypothetical protein
MSGEPVKHRVITSGRLVSPVACCRDFDARALRFKQSINGSVYSGRLQADIAVKALGWDISRKQDEGNTDNKKREFTGESMPGVEKNAYGYRWKPEARWEPGSKLVLSPTIESIRGMDIEPNFGWIPEKEREVDSFDKLLNKLRNKPHIKISKFDVNPKTDEVDTSSEKIVDPFAMSTGMTMEERRRRLNKGKNVEEKSLGPNLGARVPGGSLLARAAAAVGILRDENNKFRCPPGTPAANQFTDAMGSNCFGFSASRFARFAARQAAELSNQGEMQGLRNSARNVLDFVYNGRWFRDLADADPARIGRSPWYDAATGERIETPDWRDVDGPENLRVTTNGMINAQDEIARADAEVLSLLDDLGVDISDEARATNEDLGQAFDTLRQMANNGDPRGWDVNLVNANGVDQPRLTPQQVEQFVTARLQAVQGWTSLSKEEQDLMVKADTARYYETERAFLESLLVQFKRNPSAAKFLGTIMYDSDSNHEAGTSLMRDAAQIIDMTDPVTGKTRKVKIPGEMRGVIDFNMDMIMSNQETMLPNMGAGQRLSIAAIGGRTDAESQMALSHFMLNADLAARHMAGLVDGPKSFTRHIGIHEFAHLVQAQGFMEEIDRRAKAGMLEVPQFSKRGDYLGQKKINSLYDLSAGDIMNMMTQTADGINLKELGDVMSRLEGVAQFSGAYPREYEKGSEIWALEALAELYALREQKLISGDDVDSVLEFMDDIMAKRAETSAAIASATYDLDEVDSPDIDSPTADVLPGITPEELDAMAEEALVRRVADRRETLKAFRSDYSGLTQEEMFDVATEIATDYTIAKESLDEIEKSEIPSGLTPEETDAATRARQELLDIAIEEAQFHEKKYDDARREWKKKYGIGARSENARFDAEVGSLRESRGLLSPSEAAKNARARQLDAISEDITQIDDKKAIRKMADTQVLMKANSDDVDKSVELAEEFDTMKNAMIEKLRAGGDKRSRSRISKEIDEKIEALNSPKPKPTRKFKSKADADSFVKSRRASQSRRLTPRQREAIRQIGTGEDVDISNVLDPQKQVSAGRAINRRNARLARLGLEVDENSSSEAPLDRQVQNVLIPTMEAIDATSITEPFEIEAIVEVESGKVSGRSVGKDVQIDSLVTGRLMPKGRRPTKLTRQQESDAPEGKKKKRVVISLKEGDKGIFSSPGEDGESRFILPPGSLRVVSRGDDGTIYMEVSSQKNAVEAAESLRDSLSNGTDDAIWRKGASNRVGKVVNEYVTARRESRDIDSPRNDSDKQIAETNSSINEQVVDAGSSFGEGIDDVDLQGASESLSSGRSIYGPKQTRAQRTESRRSKISSNAKEIRNILSGKGSKEFPELSKENIDPRVAELIMNLPDEELHSLIEETAYRMHSGLDRRAHVRMRESEVDEMLITGTVRSPLASSSDDSPVASRRIERILRRNSSGTREDGFRRAMQSESLSSGAVKKGIGERLKGRAMNQIAERMGLDDEEKEVMELVVDTAAAMRFGPQAALTKLGMELARRGSRDLAEFVVEKLKEDDRINDEQAKMILKRMNRVAPEGLPEPLKDAAVSAARGARRMVDTPENRERIATARESAGRRARRLRDASAERVREMRDRITGVEAINDAGETGPPIGLPPVPVLRGEPRVTLSSGRVERTLKPGSISPQTSKIKSSRASISLGENWRDQIEVYEIGGKRVAFGVPNEQSWESDISDVEVLPINPFVISGLDETSDEGRELAIKWTLAGIGLNEEGNDSKTEASSILYAATRGDTDAQKRLDDLAEAGQKTVDASRKNIAQLRQETIDREAAAREKTLSELRRALPDASEEEIQRRARPSRSNGFSGLSVDDLYLVHETTYEPQYDSDGNLVIRPTGDYPMLDENGQPLLDDNGRPWDTYRGTIHFSINHRVSGHQQRETPEASNVIMIPLKDVIAANPGALDNLYGVDTYLTPPPGEPLKLPASAVRTLKLEKGETDPWGKVHTELESMGMSPDVRMYGGTDSVGLDADQRISGIAAQLDVENKMHSHSDNAHFEKTRKHDGMSFPVTPGIFANLSRNALLRLMHQDRWSGANNSLSETTRSVV